MRYILFIMLIITSCYTYSAAPREKIAQYQREENFEALASYLNTLHHSTLSSRERSDLEKGLEYSINQKTSLSHHYTNKYNQTGGPAYEQYYIEAQQQVAFASQALTIVKKLDDDAYDAVEYRLQWLD